MKEIKITVPDNCELKQVGNTYTIVEKEKKLTYEDITKKLFPNDKIHYYITDDGDILNSYNREITRNCKNNATSKKQLEKLLAINMLMNVAKYLNDGWQPDWEDTNEYKYFIAPNHDAGSLDIEEDIVYQNSYIYFKSEELAQQAIEILGEETIKLALCTNY